MSERKVGNRGLTRPVWGVEKEVAGCLCFKPRIASAPPGNVADAGLDRRWLQATASVRAQSIVKVELRELISHRAGAIAPHLVCASSHQRRGKKLRGEKLSHRPIMLAVVSSFGTWSETNIEVAWEKCVFTGQTA
jgi:hypothetical protein